MKRSLILLLPAFLLWGCEESLQPRPEEVSLSVKGGSSTLPETRPANAAAPPATLKKKEDPRSSFRKKGSRRSRPDPVIPLPDDGKRPDTSLIGKLRRLTAAGIEPDFSEPANRNRILGQMQGDLLPPMLVHGRESLLRINFDNDILDYTDRFYTNGIRIELIAPALRANPLCRLLLPYRGTGSNHYGLALAQNMYTPSTTKTGGILYGDRPYAAYLFAGAFKISNDPVRRFRQTSELDAGIIGPGSYGEWVQRAFHQSVPTNHEPLGWEYQVQNDLVLNYHVTLEKGVVGFRHLDLTVTATGSLGTLYTNASGGAHLRAGWFNPAFAGIHTSQHQGNRPAALRKFQAFLFLKGSSRLVGYDATLQGGIFNRSSKYTFPAREISRLVFQTSGGITLSYRGLRLDVEQFMLSPEFHDGWWHKWVHIALGFGL